MQTTEKLNKIYQSCNKSLMELSELNVATFNNIMKNSAYVEKLSHLRKPEDFMSAQSELLSNASNEAAKYIQKVCQINIDAMTDANQAWMDWIHETVSKAQDVVKKSKEREQE